MADARKFTNPDLAHKPPPTVRERSAERPRHHAGPPRGEEREERHRHHERPGHDGDHREPEQRTLPPRFDFHGEDLLKLIDGLTQSTVLSGLPVQFEPPPKLREVTGKILDQMGFPEDLLPAEAFDPKGRWKILAGCIIAYAGLGAWQAVQQRKITMALINQQMAARAASGAAQAADAQEVDGKARAAPTAQPGKEEPHGPSVGHSTDGGNEPH